MKKVAVILFNLGGPDNLKAVKPFLFNLFHDRAIIDLPQPFRFLLAKLISAKRHKKAQEIYKKINNKSPIFELTLAQAESLEKALSYYGDFKVFINMRYWHPMIKETVQKILNYQPDEIILLPLYPQFSSSTTKSSLENFIENFPDKNIPIKAICCYPEDDNFIDAHLNLITQKLQKFSQYKIDEMRFLFSAHGLPQKLIDQGDPYVYQVAKSTAKIIEKLQKKYDKIDYTICYQSKVGPLKWTSPSLEQELHRAILDKKIPVIIPIAFVSEHSETLVELDIEYREMAEKLKAKNYIRIPALNSDVFYIKSLSEICLSATKTKENSIFCGKNKDRICPKNFKFCPNQNHSKHD